MSFPNWFCAQIGAREHYAVPRALHQTGRLAGLATDFWAGPVARGLWAQSRKLIGESRNGKAVEALRSLATRHHPELGKAGIGKQTAEITSWNWRALWWELLLRRQKAEGGRQRMDVRGQGSVVRGPYHGFIEVGRRFATCVREDLKRRQVSGPAIFYAYDTGALEAFAWCREHGIKCVLNQMDPNRVEVELVLAEELKWPGWAPQANPVPEEYFVRREQEWTLADRVVVNSEFSRQALLQQGVPAEKLVVIPLCYEAVRETRDQETKAPRDQGTEARGQQSEVRGQWSGPTEPLRVLFLGQVILRKGIQYLMQAARQLESENIRFDVVGPIGISREALATAPGNMTFHGRTGRDQAADWYRQAHLFVLPTLSDGFGLTQLEAMAHGLPVIATPCCGEVVSDGVDGFIVPPRDPDGLVQSLRRYLAAPGLLAEQSRPAQAKAGQFTVARLAENLVRLEEEVFLKK